MAQLLVEDGAYQFVDVSVTGVDDRDVSLSARRMSEEDATDLSMPAAATAETILSLMFVLAGATAVAVAAAAAAAAAATPAATLRGDRLPSSAALFPLLLLLLMLLFLLLAAAATTWGVLRSMAV